jgi:hypothetical protein
MWGDELRERHCTEPRRRERQHAPETKTASWPALRQTTPSRTASKCRTQNENERCERRCAEPWHGNSGRADRVRDDEPREGRYAKPRHACEPGCAATTRKSLVNGNEPGHGIVNGNEPGHGIVNGDGQRQNSDASNVEMSTSIVHGNTLRHDVTAWQSRPQLGER